MHSLRPFLQQLNVYFFVSFVCGELQVASSGCPTSSAMGLDPSSGIPLADFLDVMAFLATCQHKQAQPLPPKRLLGLVLRTTI